MKIDELRFKNLNSLVGEWVIDFTAPEYAANGIFALIGPTGAGKSTILDGLCLALYGATPRLGKITKSSNEIMSRQTGECYAEVLFESQEGRFRCHWEQRRARKKSSGKLQDQQHQIIDADTGAPIETKKSLVSKVIEEKTGMDFDRFTRSILLAQGSFDTFLKADDEQKSRILEQITGTSIYSSISRRVHERQRNESERLNLLKAESSTITLLDLEQKNAVHQLLKKKQKEETDLTLKLAETQKAQIWLSGIEKLKAELGSLAAEELKLNKRQDEFAPERRRLEQAIKAAAVEGRFATLVAVRTQEAEDQAALEREKGLLPELEAALNSSTQALKSAAQLTLESKKAREGAGPVLQRIRSLDQRLDDVRKNVAEIEGECKKEEGSIDSHRKSRRTILEQRQLLTEELKGIERYLTDHSDDSWLTGGLTGIEVQITQLQRAETACKEQEEAHKEARKKLTHAVAELDRCRLEAEDQRRELLDIVNKSKQQGDSLRDLLGDRLVREYRREKEYLLREQAFINRVIELEEHRAQLADGSPCPLCGSMEHPYARGNVPQPNRTEKEIERLSALIDSAEECETIISKLDESRTLSEKKLAAVEIRLTAASHRKDSAAKTCTEGAENIERLKREIMEIQESLVSKLQPLGISEVSNKSRADLLQKLQERLKSWQQQVDRKAVLGGQLNRTEAELKQLEAVIETRTRSLENIRAQLDEKTRQLLDLKEKRRGLFGDTSVNDEERRLDDAVAQAEATEKRISAGHHVAAQNVDATRLRIDALATRITQDASKLKKSEENFQAALRAAGFSDEQEFLAARLSAEEREVLLAQSQDLDSSLTALAVRKKDRRNRLDEEAARNITTFSLQELERKSEEYETSRKQLRNDCAGLNQQLEADRSSRERLKDKQTAIERQKKECERWNKLHLLIGSADGKKYRTFAQGLTFELMVSYANRQLAEMSDRYLLIRDTHQPLELNVVDNYQAGEVRSTRNLSGGESFLVSLALALGLSRMASRNVRVDSLFLDEGFGTLDEEALESALATLSALYQENKVIGIISHVPALKDRISTQISVTPLSGGRSTLNGPGCDRLQ